MGIPRLILLESLLALRWPGAIGALLVAGSAAYGAAVLLPSRDRIAADEPRVERAERRAAAVRSGAEAAPLSAAARRERFYAALPAQAELTQHVDRIYAAAVAEQLSLMHGEYSGSEVAGTGLVRYRIVLPMKGSYGQIRRFITAATAAVPGLSLDDIALQRHDVGEPQVEAKVQLSLFVARR
jgi:hypothetical protein